MYLPSAVFFYESSVRPGHLLSAPYLLINILTHPDDPIPSDVFPCDTLKIKEFLRCCSYPIWRVQLQQAAVWPTAATGSGPKSRTQSGIAFRDTNGDCDRVAVPQCRLRGKSVARSLLTGQWRQDVSSLQSFLALPKSGEFSEIKCKSVECI